MSYRVVIPTAGTGSRLGVLTKYLNKSLVSIAHRPTISHLIEQFPEDCEFVIALGHKGHLVRDFLELAYPQRTFHFAQVNPFEGESSGLGLSLLCCEKYLQQPFIFLSCDTLVKEPVPPPDQNWMGYASLEDLSSYRTVSINSKKKILNIHEKGDVGAEDHHAYIGLAGIKDYAEFWPAMRKGGQTAIAQGEAYGLRALLEKKPLDAYPFSWCDTGTPSALGQTRAEYREPNEPNILEKENEAIWFIGDRVVKFSDSTEFIENRVRRAEVLEGFVPQIIASRLNMYCYQKVTGEVLSGCISLPLFQRFLNHCQSFWLKVGLTGEQTTRFVDTGRGFYHDKTRARVELFYRNFDKEDGTERINGETMPSLSSLLEQVDWDSVARGLPGRFHGDFHFENILWNPQSETFTFLDWRQDFGGDLEVGDIYYDLAKLLHGLIVSHELIADDAFSVDWGTDSIRFDFHRKQVLVECEHYFMVWCDKNSFDRKKVRLLTALIYLNIAALHHYPYSLLLYALGKRMLCQELKKDDCA